MAAMGDKFPRLASVGNTIMVFGVSFQAAIMVLAAILTADFALRVWRRHGTRVVADLPKNLKIFLIAMTAAFLLILTRCIYR